MPSRDDTMGGRMTWRNMGSKGGERGELERGVLRMNVAMRRGVSMSPIPVDVAETSSDHVLVRNSVGGEKRREWSMSMDGALPARAVVNASRIAPRGGSFQRFEGPRGVGSSVDTVV